MPAPVPGNFPSVPSGPRHGGYPANVALPGAAGLPGGRGRFKQPGPIENRRLVFFQQFYEMLELGPHLRLHHSCRNRFAPSNLLPGPRLMVAARINLLQSYDTTCERQPCQRSVPARPFRRSVRSISRSASRFAISRRLSYLRRPRARPSSTLARPSLM